MALGDTKKASCEHCGGPAGECAEIRGGFLPTIVCRKRLTYDQLWREVQSLRALLRKLEGATMKPAELRKLIEVMTPSPWTAGWRDKDTLLLPLTNMISIDDIAGIIALRNHAEWMLDMLERAQKHMLYCADEHGQYDEEWLAEYEKGPEQ